MTMEKRRQKLLEDDLDISTRPSTLVNRKGYSAEPIPVDLIIAILSWLPVKSIARCRCVWKLWGSILGSSEFTDLFLNRSAPCPKLLFACEKDEGLFFFSSPQLQNPDEKSSLVTADYHMKFPFDNSSSSLCNSVSGLICLQHSQISKGIKETVLEICNPSTGQSLTLPKVRTNKHYVMSFLGYDPIDRQFKLLSMTLSYNKRKRKGLIRFYQEHQILTLGNTKPSWRMIECSVPHRPLDARICINGVLYYQASHIKNWRIWVYGVVCFDIRSEKFKFIENAKAVHGKLVNYKDKLSVVRWVHIGIRTLELSVLEDDETWSTQTYVVPPLLKDDEDIDFTGLHIIGVTRRGEIMLAQSFSSYLFYFDIERNTIINVDLQGRDTFKFHRITTFPDHVERYEAWGSV